MMKAEVKVGEEFYVIVLPEGIAPEDAIAFIHEGLVNGDYFTLEDGRKALINGKNDFDHIKAWEEAEVADLEYDDVPGVDHGTVYSLVDTVRFLGTDYDVQFLALHNDEDHAYYMAYTVNETQAAAALSEGNQQELINRWRQAYDATTNYEAVTTSTVFTSVEEAADYLLDYAREVESEKPYQAKEKTAKAYTGWKGGGGGGAADES